MNSAEQFNAMVDRLLKKSRNFYDHVLSPSQWTQTHRVLTSDLGAARPGRWSHDETPYLKEIMDNFAPDSGVVSQTIMKATRMGFTTAAVNVAGWVMDQFPTSRFAVVPISVKQSENYVEGLGKSVVEVVFVPTGQDLITTVDGSLMVRAERTTPQDIVADEQRVHQAIANSHHALNNNFLQHISDKVFTVSGLGTFKNAVYQPMRSINQLLGNGWRLATGWQSIFSTLEVALDGIFSAPAQIVDIMQAFLLPIQGLTSGERLQFLHTLSSSLAISLERGSHPSIQEDNAQALGSMVGQTMLTTTALSLSLESYHHVSSRVEAMSLLSVIQDIQRVYHRSIHTSFSTIQLERIGVSVEMMGHIDSGFMALKVLILEKLRTLKFLLSKTLEHDMSTLEAFYLLYGHIFSDDQYIQFVSINNFSDNEQFLLSAGREVVYYAP